MSNADLISLGLSIGTCGFLAYAVFLAWAIARLDRRERDEASSAPIMAPGE